MTTGTTVAVHDDLAAGQTGVALRSADNETARGVDEKFSLLREHARRENFLDNVLDAEFLDLSVFNIRRVLRGDDDVGNGNRLSVFIDNGDLRLRVRTEPRHLAALADLGQLAAKTMREHDRRRHELGSFIRGVAEHQTLVAGTLLVGLLAFGFAGINALRDVGRLLGDDDIDEHLVGVKHIVVVDVADFADGLAGERDEIELGLRGDLTADDGDVGFHVSFARDAGKFILRQTSVEDSVRNGIGDFVRVAFAHGLRREDVTAHDVFDFVSTVVNNILTYQDLMI